MESKRKISVFLPADLFRRFNAYCVNRGYKKSPLIARLIREHMDEEDISANGERDTNQGERTASKRSRP